MLLLRPRQSARWRHSLPCHGHVYWATFNMPEHFPPVERQTDWQVIRLPERRNYIQYDVLLCRSTNTWQAAPAADLSTGKNTHGDGSYRLTFYFLYLGGKAAEIPLLHPLLPCRGLGCRNVDWRCYTWAHLWWSASCWATLGLMNKRSPKRRRSCTKSHDWGADSRLRRFAMYFSPGLNVG